ncbi:MAG TPA: FAD-dependent oxidoreductase [Solirubrobacterales bacterium]|nr:FAD-dependent oxidoreductase [Solirubrobacterales bacterium]
MPQPPTNRGQAIDGHLSYWVKSAEAERHPPLQLDTACDVVVVGAGIVGVTCAFKLARSGARVILLEARRIGSGTTGYTTAKISSLHGLTYSKLESSLGPEEARIYAEANEAGLAEIGSLVEELTIDCDFRRKPNLTYSESDERSSSVADEVDAAKRAGLAAVLVEEVPELPYRVTAAVRVEHQAEFHPLRYLHALAAATADLGVEIHEETRVVSIDQDDPCRATTERGATVTAGHVVVATHLPILDRGLFFARTHPERSYVLLARLRGEVPEGMYLSDESPAHSLRSVPTEDGERLMVGGESHKGGQGDQAERYRALEEWARERFEVEAVEHRWATQDNMPADGLPFIGRLWPLSRRILTATGLRKWGIAMGTSAAAILADEFQGMENRWAATFSPMRLHPVAGGPDFLKQNANAGLRFMADRIRARGSESELAPGEGAVVGSGLGQRAVYRDERGELHSLSARCTHLGCIVGFNAAERTWDCPCHGSRFSLDGEVIEGPAVRGLLRRD